MNVYRRISGDSVTVPQCIGRRDLCPGDAKLCGVWSADRG